MIIFATLSKPTAQIEPILGRKYERVKIKLKPDFDVSTRHEIAISESVTAVQNSRHKKNSHTEISPTGEPVVNVRTKAREAEFKCSICDETNSHNEISHEKNATLLQAEIPPEKKLRDEKIYFVEFFTATQTFHKQFSLQEAESFLQEQIGKTFRNCTERTENEEIVFMTSKKGKVTRIAKKLKTEPPQFGAHKMLGEKIVQSQHNRKKKYIIQEGERVPFLQELGVMTRDGKIVAAKYAKFRQINRFLEFLDDIVPAVIEQKKADSARENNFDNNSFVVKNSAAENSVVIVGNSTNENCVAKNSADKNFIIPSENSADKKSAAAATGNSASEHFADENFIAENSAQPDSTSPIEPIRIVDFGSGKSYLTFAVQYYFSQKKIPFEITGVDLKKDVIEQCADLSRRLNLRHIHFLCGNIADFSDEKNPDIVITLHACDTATDFALDYAVRRGAKAILSVPCCQHEINVQLQKKSSRQELLRPLLKYGIIRERFAALVTDCVRAEILEQFGYAVQILEFIDMEGTPKNILIRAVLKKANSASADSVPASTPPEKKSDFSATALLDALGVGQTLCRIVRREN